MGCDITFPPSSMGRIRELTDELTHEETELFLFFKLSPDLFCLADPSGFLRKVNDAWTRILGWSEEELLTHRFLDFVDPRDVERTKAVMHAMEEQDVIRFHNRYKKKDSDETVVLEWSATRWTDGLTYAAARPVPKECMVCPESQKRFQDLGNNHRTGNKNAE